MNKSLKFVLIIFFIIIVPLIFLSFFYMDARADDDIQINNVDKSSGK